jgi:DNA repair exonuclease SbcCD ATPase subunit
MWNPVKIEFKNLFSHVDSSYEFKNNRCVVIFGDNRTDRSLENNGAGKTTLFEAICIALTNESLRNIKKDNFINREADSCFISFELHNPVLRKELIIQRTFFRGGKSVNVKIFENGIQNTQVTSVAEANKRVLELIGISREDLLRYYIISQDNHYTFFTASDTEKKEIMNRITSADMINPAIEELNNRKTIKQDELRLLSLETDKLSGKRETLAEQRLELLEAGNNDEEIAELEERISDTEDLLKKNKEEALVIDEEIAIVEKALSEITIPDVSNLKAERKKKRSELDSFESELRELNRVKKNLKNELSDSIECPSCGHEFIQSDLGLSVEDAERLLSETDKEISKVTKKIEDAEAKIKTLTIKIEKAESIQERYDEFEDKLNRLKRKRSNKKNEEQDLQKKIKRYEEQIVALKDEKKDNSAIKKIEAKIKECDDEISRYNEAMKPIEEELDLIKFWLFNMGKSGFMTYLANKSVKIIEGITNSYLRKFGVDISVLINGFTILKSGEVREKIDVFVSNDGVTSENFMAKSGGERGRVTLAGVLGIQHLINLSSNGGGLNLLVFDECFHGMDSRGQENIIKIFEKMGVTILVITQNVSEGFNNENTLRVVKENGVSRYISNTQS